MPRRWTRHASSAAIALSFLLGIAGPPGAAQEELDEELAAAVRSAARWVAEQAQPMAEEDGVLFPEYAESPAETETFVYAGTAGVLIFLENAAAILEDVELGELADRTAAGLLAVAEDSDRKHVRWSKDPRAMAAEGLYTGDAGVGHAFLVRARLRGSRADLKVARRAADDLLDRSQKDGDGRTWSHQLDAIGGATGTLLFLLELFEETGDRRYRQGALDAGRWLIQEATPVEEEGSEDGDQLTWGAARSSERHYPNFSHGTAGTAYALARVADATGDKACLEAAVAGARWLLLHGEWSEDSLCWYHYSPGREDSFQEGWCHGPPGTGRLFFLLARLTGQEAFEEAARRSARWVMASRPDPGDPSSSTRFYSPSLCCGAAGILDYFVDAWRATGEEEYLEYARGVAAYLLRLAKEDPAGLKWTNYDRPDEEGVIFHGVSLMLGTSGEALALLRLAAIEREQDPVCHLPDRRVTASRRMKTDEIELPR